MLEKETIIFNNSKLINDNILFDLDNEEKQAFNSFIIKLGGKQNSFIYKCFYGIQKKYIIALIKIVGECLILSKKLVF